MSKTKILLLCFPALLTITPFLAACFFIFRFSFSANQGAIEGFSFTPYLELADPFFIRSLLTTFKLASFSTVIVIVLAIPLALVMATVQKPWLRRLLSVAILMPMILNLLIQSYGWIILLGPTGVLNTSLRELGLISRPIMLLFNESGVLLGLVQTALPLAVFPILTATRNISEEHIEAACVNGASHWRCFFDITLPLLKPGIISGASIVFAYNASAFAIPLLLGGRRVQMLGVAIRDYISPLFNWSGAAAAGMVLIALTIGVLALANYLTQRWTVTEYQS
ncbi:ABC transporter permease [Alginatibacterium sediminis]|uniref:ABC transporter permease n=1 Tax=Alginatibacterium sediminis TaxID=2164068 RepID=A0A420E7G7_9ALTE|nr:ABC transporter permease [Alginatibacterium sediminis]RKF14355.1 ABC transporter permease [Alginatibacterium sediminis]